MHSAPHKLLSPVKAWARVISRIHSSKDASPDTPVNTSYRNNKPYIITGSDLLKALCAAALVIGEHKLGFKTTDIGTYLIRSGAAMAMYLDEVPVYTIMLIGRWSSDAFLLYICKQVEQFSHKVSTWMIRNLEFSHIPSKKLSVDQQDPRTRNHRVNFQTRLNMGSQALRVILTSPSFSLHS